VELRERKEVLPQITDNALEVLKQRYFLKDAVDHPIEDVEQFFRRVVTGVIDSEMDAGWSTAEEVKQVTESAFLMLRGLRFMPNSPCLMNSGKPQGYNQMAACFVLPIDDSLRSIKQADFDAALIHQSGGGTGFNFSKLRPRGDFVRGSGGVASGPISFMSVIDYSCGEVKQGGTRRGANMGIINVDHPDIMEFIHCKNEDGRISNFNISVGITDAFMDSVGKGQEYDLINPRTGKVHVEPTTGKEQRLLATDVWNELIQSAWLNGEPGIIFLDRIRRTNPTPNVEEQNTTNPCGEQPLLPYEACVLGSIKLNAYITPDNEIDWDFLRNDLHLSIRFLDDMVEASSFPLEAIDQIVKHGNRRVGLGVMGWADMLYELEIPYNSEAAVALAEKMMGFINDECRVASEELAAIRGPFPNWEHSIWHERGDKPRRNATVTTIAPTGTISMIANASGGVEPQFALVYWKNVMRNSENEATSLRYLNKSFEDYAIKHEFYGEDLIEAIEANHGSIRIGPDTPDGAMKVLQRVPLEARDIFITAHDVSPEAHIRMQAAFQQHTENAVSKTINFPNNAVAGDIEDAYRLAYDLGCKGVTVYRDGSRQFQVMTTSDVEGEAESDPEQISTPGTAIYRDRPKMVSGTTSAVPTGCGDLFVTLNDDEDGNPFEAFATLGKAGGCAAAQTEAIGRLISLALRSGLSAEKVQRQLRGITCHRPFGIGPNRTLSCADAIGKAIAAKYLDNTGSYQPYIDAQGEGTYTEDAQPKSSSTDSNKRKDSSPRPNGAVIAVQESMIAGREMVPVYDVAQEQGACPTCGGSQMYFSEGCVTCVVCGFSECG
jgi:ribonucleoside-diphosphate reductase alpha chain